jgi:hypothetical protein
MYGACHPIHTVKLTPGADGDGELVEYVVVSCCVRGVEC